MEHFPLPLPLQSNSQTPLGSHQIPIQIPTSPKINHHFFKDLTKRISSMKLIIRNLWKLIPRLSRLSKPIQIKWETLFLNTSKDIKRSWYRRILFQSYPILSTALCALRMPISSPKSEACQISPLDIQCWTNRHYQIPLKVLFKSLAYLKDLTHFKLELNYYIFTHLWILHTLFKSLQHLKKLQSLSLCFV